jgi:hypothetical protein
VGHIAPVKLQDDVRFGGADDGEALADIRPDETVHNLGDHCRRC